MPFEYVFFLGSHPDISAVEVWRWLVLKKLQPIFIQMDNNLLVVSLGQELNTSLGKELGGVDRIGQIVKVTPSLPTSSDIITALSPLPKKMSFGLSTIGIQSFGRKFLVDIKKQAKEFETRLSFVEAKKGTQLSSAQVLFNSLYKAPHAEMTVAPREAEFMFIRTIWVQDIPAYEVRDTARPARDAKVGMLPPKLAQTMLNIGVSAIPDAISHPVILDPFCGMGTILQEGWLRGYTMIGSDKEKRMIEATQTNLQWLTQHYSTLSLNGMPRSFVHDAQEFFPSDLDDKVDAVVTEPYLGTPLSKPLSEAEAQEFFSSLRELYKRFFISCLKALKPRGVLLTLLPQVALQGSQKRFLAMPAAYLDDFAAIGYRMEQLVPPELQKVVRVTERGTLVYARPDAFVGREITLWRKL